MRRTHHLRALGITPWRLRDGGVDPETEQVVEPVVELVVKPAGVPASQGAPEVVRSDPAAGRETRPGVDPWRSLAARVRQCDRCELHKGRKHALFGDGPQNAPLMVVGDVPGVDEDSSGHCFVGPPGELLDAMLKAIGMSRQSNVFVTNIVKCRPPQNREIRPDEANACRSYLDRQIELQKPRLILALGKTAAHNLLAIGEKVGQMRGRDWQHAPSGTPVLVSYHPSFLLRSPAQKSRAWEDLKSVRERLSADA